MARDGAEEKGMRGTIVALSLVTLAGCAPSQTCIKLLDRAESGYRDALVAAQRAVPDRDADAMWRAVLSDFSDVQGADDEVRRCSQLLKLRYAEEQEELRKDLERRFFPAFRQNACLLAPAAGNSAAEPRQRGPCGGQIKGVRSCRKRCGSTVPGTDRLRVRRSEKALRTAIAAR